MTLALRHAGYEKAIIPRLQAVERCKWAEDGVAALPSQTVLLSVTRRVRAAGLEDL